MKLKVIAAVLIAAGTIATPSSATAGAKDLNSCCAPTDQDFPKNGGNLGNQSYSSLSQINKSNINKLGAAWMVHTSTEPATTPNPSPGVPDAQQQTTPIAVDGVVYTDT